MATLLLKLQGERSFNRTVFPPKLYVYDDMVIYKKTRYIFWTDEITFSYNQIAQVMLKTGLIFAQMEIATTGTDNITIKFLPRKKAKMAKNIIDQKIYHAHAKHHNDGSSPGNESALKTFEKALGRLEELTLKGRISKSAYNKAKTKLLGKIR